MGLQAGRKVFPRLGPTIEVCKICAGRYRLEFYGLEYLSVSPKDVGYCEICGGFKPLMSVRNKERPRAPKWKENEEAHKINRRSNR
jgi:hypothetical protein